MSSDNVTTATAPAAATTPSPEVQAGIAAKAVDLLDRDPSLMSEKELSEFRKALTLEKDKLELAELRRQNKLAKGKEEELVRQQESQMRSYENLRIADEQLQKRCNHRKGGTDTASLAKQGDATVHSVIKHTGTFGGQIVLCTRCLKLWLPRDPNHNGKPTPGYAEATAYPSDNTASSSVVFGAQIPNVA